LQPDSCGRERGYLKIERRDVQHISFRSWESNHLLKRIKKEGSNEEKRLFTLCRSLNRLYDGGVRLSTLALSGRFKGIVGEFDKLAKAWTGLVNERGGIYVKEYGKKLPIRIQIYDDASKQENARKFYEKMAADPNIAFFLGPFSSFISNAAQTQDSHADGLRQ
jgi:hypothetical protein